MVSRNNKSFNNTSNYANNSILTLLRQTSQSQALILIDSAIVQSHRFPSILRQSPSTLLVLFAVRLTSWSPVQCCCFCRFPLKYSNSKGNFTSFLGFFPDDNSSSCDVTDPSCRNMKVFCDLLCSNFNEPGNKHFPSLTACSLCLRCNNVFYLKLLVFMRTTSLRLSHRFRFLFIGKPHCFSI